MIIRNAIAIGVMVLVMSSSGWWELRMGIVIAQ